MKTQFLKSLSCGLIFSAVLFSTSCKENEILAPEATEKQDDSDKNAKLGIPTKFDQVAFAQRIEDYLDPKVAGFGYSIFNDGKEYFNTNGGDGVARKHIESSFQAHGAIVKQETLKTTQYVTALAVLRIIKKYNLTLSTKVWPYLPKSWKPSDKFKTLDFERLLAHRTGLLNYNDLTKLKLTVEGPVNDPIFNAKSRENNDINYLLLGIITPYVEAVELKKLGSSTKLNELDAVAENFTAWGTHYRNIVRTNVFVPAGLENASIIDWQTWDNTGPISSSLGTKGYPAKLGDAPGISKGINRFNCGVTGLYLSASQFAKLQSAVAQFKVVSLADLELMKSKLLGFDGKLVGTKGSYFYKSSIGDNNETIIFDFGKIQVAIFANSPESDLSDPTVVAMMFENSFIPL
jgi:hypothetical protein